MFTKRFRAELWFRDGGRCQLCGEPVEPGLMHVDHIKPRVEGGSDAPSNLRTVHQRCNLTRTDTSRAGGYPRVTLAVRVPTFIRDRLKEIASEDNQSLPALIETALTNYTVLLTDLDSEAEAARLAEFNRLLEAAPMA